LKASPLPSLCLILSKPKLALTLNAREWDLLIRQARSANVLATLGYLFDSEGLLNQIPAQPHAHIVSAQTYAARFNISLQREISCIQEALKAVDISLVLLKGSAYFIDGNKAAQGRIFSDVDILVPANKLLEVEAALINAGWLTNTVDPYDQNYYRQWMHEIPPLIHLKRQTSIDVHHNILPKTCKLCPDATKLLSNIVNSSNKKVWVLAPEDRVLHSATHLFHEGDFTQGFRDLLDLNLLLTEFSTRENFWPNLLHRSEELKQTLPLYYTLRYTRLILKTQVPEEVLTASEKPSTSKIKQKLMDALFLRALMPIHESCNDRWTGLARWLLFFRSHWLKMPFYLLVMHLTRKAYRRGTGKDQH
jgi:hypothetical protein